MCTRGVGFYSSALFLLQNLVIPSPLPDITIERTSLTSFLLRRAMDYGDKIAFMSAPDSVRLWCWCIFCVF